MCFYASFSARLNPKVRNQTHGTVCANFGFGAVVW